MVTSRLQGWGTLPEASVPFTTSLSPLSWHTWPAGGAGGAGIRGGKQLREGQLQERLWSLGLTWAHLGAQRRAPGRSPVSAVLRV